jgi:hypothetical protein
VVGAGFFARGARGGGGTSASGVGSGVGSGGGCAGGSGAGRGGVGSGPGATTVTRSRLMASVRGARIDSSKPDSESATARRACAARLTVSAVPRLLARLARAPTPSSIFAGPVMHPFDAQRPLTTEEDVLVARARDTAHVLYEGVRVAHRSCGIALAETFGLPTGSYQALRRGGLTGQGECGAIKAGELVLGELLGDPDPAGGVTPGLAAAVRWYQAAWPAKVDTGGVPVVDGRIVPCNTLTRRFVDFMGQDRKTFCTSIAATVAALVAEALVRAGAPPRVAPLPER